MMEGLPIYSKSTEFNGDLIQSTFTETPRILFGKLSGHHDPAN